MSKKLMMNNYSENGLMPVIDGLVLWINTNSLHDESLIHSNTNNGYSVRTYGNVIVTNDGIECIGTGTKGGAIITNESYDTRYGEFCIEINFKRENLITTSTIFSQQQGGARLQTRNNSLESYSNIYGISTGEIIDITQTHNIVTVNATTTEVTIYLNGIAVYSNLLGTPKFNDKIAFNTRYLGSVASDAIDTVFKSIKIYNRALTEEEIAQNYDYEQSINRGE